MTVDEIVSLTQRLAELGVRRWKIDGVEIEFGAAPTGPTLVEASEDSLSPEEKRLRQERRYEQILFKSSG